MKTIDRVSLRRITERMSEVLGDLGKELGISITVGHASFTHTFANIKVTAAVIGDEGEAETQEREAFKKYAGMYGLQPTDLDRIFVYDGRRHTVKGLLVKSRKFPVLVQRDDGSMRKFPIATVKMCLQAADQLGKGKLG